MAGGVGPISRIAPQIPIEHVTYQKHIYENVQTTEKDSETKQEGISEKDQEDDSWRLQDIVAISEDGDTVQVSEDGKVQLAWKQISESTVESDTDKSQGKEEIEDFTTITSSYRGYTDARLEQMYLEGKISRHDYEVEVERREQEEEDSEERQDTFSKFAGKFDNEMQSATRTENAIKSAFSDEASQTTDPKTRLDAMERLDQLAEEERKEKELQFSIS